MSAIRANAPQITFATLTTSLGTIDNEEKGTTYDIDVFENDIDAITYDDFKNAFYNNNAENLSIFNHATAPTNMSQTLKDKLKNLLYLNSGGKGVVGDINYLPRKVINDKDTGSRNEFIILSYIIKDIITASNRDYDQWTTDSQISLSQKMTKFNYFSDFIIGGALSNTIANSLTKTELEKIINTSLYLKSIQTGSSAPETGDTFNVSLNIGVIFTSTVTGATSTTKTQFLYKILIKDFPYSSQ